MYTIFYNMKEVPKFYKKKNYMINITIMLRRIADKFLKC